MIPSEVHKIYYISQLFIYLYHYTTNISDNGKQILGRKRLCVEDAEQIYCELLKIAYCLNIFLD